MRLIYKPRMKLIETFSEVEKVLLMREYETALICGIIKQKNTKNT